MTFTLCTKVDLCIAWLCAHAHFDDLAWSWCMVTVAWQRRKKIKLWIILTTKQAISMIGSNMFHMTLTLNTFNYMACPSCFMFANHIFSSFNYILQFVDTIHRDTLNCSKLRSFIIICINSIHCDLFVHGSLLVYISEFAPNISWCVSFQAPAKTQVYMFDIVFLFVSAFLVIQLISVGLYVDVVFRFFFVNKYFYIIYIYIYIYI